MSRDVYENGCIANNLMGQIDENFSNKNHEDIAEDFMKHSDVHEFTLWFWWFPYNMVNTLNEFFQEFEVKNRGKDAFFLGGCSSQTL